MSLQASASTPDLERLRHRLLRLARCRYGAGADAQDAVQETLLAVWARGASWHEGRIVLELQNQVRRIRRKAETRKDVNVDLIYDESGIVIGEAARRGH